MRIQARKTLVDGILFDSLSESKFYNILLKKQQEGAIKGFSMQPEFRLIPDFLYQGEEVRGAIYTSDFKILHNDLTEEIIEIKGYADDLYNYRIKLFKWLHQDVKLTVLTEHPKNSGQFVLLDELKKIKSKEKRAKNHAKKKAEQATKRTVTRIEGQRIQRRL